MGRSRSWTMTLNSDVDLLTWARSQSASVRGGELALGNSNFLFRSRRMLGELYAPAPDIPRKFDVKGRPFSTAVRIPAVDAVAFDSKELMKFMST